MEPKVAPDAAISAQIVKAVGNQGRALKQKTDNQFQNGQDNIADQPDPRCRHRGLQNRFELHPINHLFWFLILSLCLENPFFILSL